MDSNSHKLQMTDVNKMTYNICSINIAGLSARSKFVMEKYCYDKSIDILAIQESFSKESVNQNLRFMKSVSDNNNSVNRGAMLFVNSQKLSIIPLNEISNLSKEIDAAWGLVTGPGIKLDTFFLEDTFDSFGAISNLTSFTKNCFVKRFKILC